MHPIALGDKDTTVFFEQGDSNFTGKISENGTTVKINMLQLDTWIEQNGVYPNFIKIDVEGYEEKVLIGSKKILEKQSAILLIELHNPEQDKKVAEILEFYGYEFYRVNPEASGITNLLIPILNKKEGWPNINGVWGNILAIPKDKATLISTSVFVKN